LNNSAGLIPTILGFAAFAFATFTSFNSPAAAASLGLEGSARQLKIAEVRSDLNIKIDVNTFDAMVPLLARTVAPGDSSWNPEHPKWIAVCALITRDLHRDLADAVGSEQKSMDAKWEAALDQSLTDSDLNQLLDFYRSSMGKRYLKFQKSLDPIIVAGGAAFIGSMSTARPVKGMELVSPSPQTIALRQRAFRLAFSNCLAAPALQNSRAKQARDMVEQTALSTQGPALDAIARRYSADLPSFEQFQRSAPVNLIVGAGQTLMVTQGRSSEGNALQGVLMAEPTKHASQWQAVYASH
jgi:hypothetical protein